MSSAKTKNLTKKKIERRKMRSKKSRKQKRKRGRKKIGKKKKCWWVLVHIGLILWLRISKGIVLQISTLH